MRDPTKRRNYSAEGEEFRREHAEHRDWGLEQRHARKLRLLYGSVEAAWAAFDERVEELPWQICSAPIDKEAGPPPEAGSDIMTETPPARPIPALPETALPETALPETALPAAAMPEGVTPGTAPPAAAGPDTVSPGIALSGTVSPETVSPVDTTSAQVEHIPVVCDASVSEVLTPETIPAETAPIEPARDHHGRTAPSPGQPTPSPQTALAGSDPTVTEPLSAAEPLSVRRTAEAPTTSHPQRGNPSARPSPSRPANRYQVDQKNPAAPHRQPPDRPGPTTRRARRKQTPSTGNNRANPASNKHTTNRTETRRSRRIFQRRQPIPADVEHCCGHEP
jgi:hypothetical protein